DGIRDLIVTGVQTCALPIFALKKARGKTEFRNNAWFVGYAPASRPEIVVAVLVIEGEHSTVAVPVAREVIKAYYDKKQPHADQRSEERRVGKECRDRGGEGQ